MFDGVDRRFLRVDEQCIRSLLVSVCPGCGDGASREEHRDEQCDREPDHVQRQFHDLPRRQSDWRRRRRNHRLYRHRGPAMNPRSCTSRSSMKGKIMNGALWRSLVMSLSLVLLIAPRASAQAARVFLSGTGNDAGDCSNAATPCRSLQGAIDQAAAGAEVVVVSSGGYGGARITESITVNAPTGLTALLGRTIPVTIAGTDEAT